MAFYGVRLSPVWPPAGRHIVVAYTTRIEPILERGAPAAVPEHAAIPHTLHRRDLVVARAAPSFQCAIGIGSNRDRHDVEFLSMVRWNREAVGRRQLVVRVERRRVTCGAALAIEHLLSLCRDRIEGVRVRRRLQ